MNFDTPELVSSTIENLKTADIRRAPDRALIDELFNGGAPYTEQEERENHIQVNVNWGEGSDLLLQARQQFESAFLTTGDFFTIRVPDAPASKRNDYSGVLTSEANKILKHSRAAQYYMHTQREKWGSVALHGKGAQLWEDECKVIPYFVPVADLLIPTDTPITLEGLTYFAVRRRMKPKQLYRKTFGMGKNVDPGWDLNAVGTLLAGMKDVDQDLSNWNWYEHPERMVELWKQNKTWYESDTPPAIWLWDFYYQEEDKPDSSWQRVVILDKNAVTGKAENTDISTRWIYRKDKPFAENLSEILHIQFNDGNNVPPFEYHSCRGLGQRLFDTVHMMNRVRCQTVQKVIEDMMLLFHVSDPVDKGRLDKIYLGMTYGAIPDGLSFVRREERYSPDWNAVEMIMSNFKQLMGESTQGYTQDIDNGTKKERTAFEVNALLNQTTKLTSSMLNLAYLQETFAYQEICRRLALEGTHDFDAKHFQAACTARGVPKKWMDSRRWEVESERVLGSGNQQIEMAQAQSLLAIRPLLNPEGQQRVTSKYVFAVTHDPKVVQELAPYDATPHVSDTIHDTELVFGTLMQGNQVTPKPGLNPIEVVETMLRLMGGRVQQVMQSGGVGTPQDVNGLANAERYTGAFIQMLAQDDKQKERVTAYGKALGKIMNMVKAFAQRQQQAAKQQNGNGQIDPEKLIDLQFKQAADQQKLKIKEQSHQQKLVHNEQKFRAQQQQGKLKTLADISTKAAMAAGQRQSSSLDE